jgi:hypothetical protein
VPNVFITGPYRKQQHGLTINQGHSTFAQLFINYICSSFRYYAPFLVTLQSFLSLTLNFFTCKAHIYGRVMIEGVIIIFVRDIGKKLQKVADCWHKFCRSGLFLHQRHHFFLDSKLKDIFNIFVRIFLSCHETSHTHGSTTWSGANVRITLDTFSCLMVHGGGTAH